MRAALMLAALAVSACAPYPPYPPPHTPYPPGAPPPGQDMCRAQEHRWLIGRHRSEIPREPPRATWRVTCLGCPVTLDYNPNRLNILYDDRSGIVREVSCG